LIKGRFINAVGKTSLGELAALVRRLRLLVSADSGPAHIASALGVPVVVVWSGANDHKQWRPTGEKVSLVTKEMPCSPCEKKFCKDNACINEISVEEVVNAVRRLWEAKVPCSSA